MPHSYTEALEKVSILAGIKPGDEISISSYNFIFTSNAFVLQGEVIVFVGIMPDSMNIEENLIEVSIIK